MVERCLGIRLVRTDRAVRRVRERALPSRWDVRVREEIDSLVRGCLAFLASCVARHFEWSGWHVGRLRVMGRGVVFVVVLPMAVACSSSVPETSPSTSMTSAPVTTATPTTVAPSTTLSERELELREIAAAEAEISEVVEAWYTFDLDTSRGEAGLPLEFLTGPIRDRYAGLDDDPSTIQRSRGGDRIEVLSVAVDLDQGLADVEACTSADHELVEADTGEVIAADDGDAWIGQIQLDRVDGVWLISDFFSDEAAAAAGGEGRTCALS